ncbi:MAG TPA: hypothetical protein PL033_21380 [Candidatus Brocadiia bacterium]|nr:hypothetical protein [Candidatus Brocadiia bacterium]
MAITVNDFIRVVKGYITDRFLEAGQATSQLILYSRHARAGNLPLEDKAILEDTDRVVLFRKACNLFQAAAVLHFFEGRVGSPEEVHAWRSDEDAPYPDGRECFVLEVETRDEHYSCVWPIIRRRNGPVSLGAEEVHPGTIATWPDRKEIICGVGYLDGLEPEEIESMGLAVPSDQAEGDNPSQ